MSWHIAVICCIITTELFPDLGVLLIKIEKPSGRDLARSVDPFFHYQPTIRRTGFFASKPKEETITLKRQTSPIGKSKKEVLKEKWER